MKRTIILILLIFLSACKVEDRVSFTQCGIMAQKCPKGYERHFIGGQCMICVKENRTYDNPFIETVDTFEEVPENSTYCIQNKNISTNCYWIHSFDGKWRKSCWKDSRYLEDCYVKGD